MEKTPSPVVNLWAQEYSRHLNSGKPYELTEQFQKLATLFSPGSSYYYIMNMQNLHIDFVSPEVENITGLPPEDVDIQKLVEMALEEEVEQLIKKEMVIKDFFQRFLAPEDLTSYKILYSYRMATSEGTIKHMLHQAMALTVSDEGQVQHVMSIHTDVTHLKLPKNDKLSFISLSKKKSYYNLDVKAGVFDPTKVEENKPLLFQILTNREREILVLLARGYNAQKISEMLHLSFNTVRTHRKNMLRKAQCSNTTELVSRIMMEGAIS